MRKIIQISFLCLLCLLVASCKKDENKWFRVTYNQGYCPRQGASWLYLNEKTSFTKKTKIDGSKVYSAAVLNIPDRFKVKGKVFYIKVHYDESDDFKNVPICTDDSPDLKIVVCDQSTDSRN